MKKIGRWLGATGINPVYGLLTQGERYEFEETDFEKYKSEKLVTEKLITEKSIEEIKLKTKKEN